MSLQTHVLTVSILIGIFVILLSIYQTEFNFEIEKQNDVEKRYQIIDIIHTIINNEDFEITQITLQNIAKENQIITVYDTSSNLIASSKEMGFGTLPFDVTQKNEWFADNSNSYIYICGKNQYTVCLIENETEIFRLHILEREDNYLSLSVVGVIIFIVIFAVFSLLNNNLKLRKNLEILHKQKDDFAAMASHELRTPLVPIKGFAEILQKEDESDKKELKKIFGKIYKNAARMDRLIENIILAQKLESNQMKIHKNKFRVNSLIDEIVESFSKNNTKNVQFIKNIENVIQINSDQDKIHQILTNLILNSIDFVHENQGIITIGAVKKHDKVLFSISDNGTGISKENLDKLFLKYYQVNNSITRKHTGFGLGLSICKNLVEALGGKISAKSIENQETTFYFEIPEGEI